MQSMSNEKLSPINACQYCGAHEEGTCVSGIGAKFSSSCVVRQTFTILGLYPRLLHAQLPLRLLQYVTLSQPHPTPHKLQRLLQTRVIPTSHLHHLFARSSPSISRVAVRGWCGGNGGSWPIHRLRHRVRRRHERIGRELAEVLVIRELRRSEGRPLSVLQIPRSLRRSAVNSRWQGRCHVCHARASMRSVTVRRCRQGGRRLNLPHSFSDGVQT